MRHIPTTTLTVDSLRKQAKRLQRKGGGKHTELLDRVARGAGYAHWHHVDTCHKATEGKRGVDALNEDIAVIERVALTGDPETSRIIVTGPQTGFASLLLFASQGDAWMLDPEEEWALCLVWHRKVLAREIIDREGEVEVHWDGPYSVTGGGFAVDTRHPDIGQRVILGYPITELRTQLEHTRSNQRVLSALLDPSMSEPLTPGLVEELTQKGWERDVLDAAAVRGDRYSRVRDSILSRPVVGSHEEGLG